MTESGKYYVVQEWMISKLKLSGVEKDVYAIVYGFSQDGETEFYGSRGYLANFTGSSKSTIDRALKSLVDKGLIIKRVEEINKVKFNRYSANLDALKYEDPLFKMSTPPIQNDEGAPIQNDDQYYNKDTIVEKTPAKQVSPTKTKTRRNFSKNTLSDDLASGEEIKKQTKEKKRKSKEEQCIDYINSIDYSEDVKSLLLKYFSWNYHSNNPKKIKTVSDLKQKVNRLEQLVKKGISSKEIIQCAIDNQWYGFFEPIKESKSRKYDSPGVPDDGVISQKLHGEEVKKELERRKQSGSKVY